MRFKGSGLLALILGATAAVLLVAAVVWGAGGLHAIVGGAAPESEKSSGLQQVATYCCGSTLTCNYAPAGSSIPECCSCACWKYAGTNPSGYVCPQWCGAPCCNWCEGAACLEPCAVAAPSVR